MGTIAGFSNTPSCVDISARSSAPTRFRLGSSHYQAFSISQFGLSLIERVEILRPQHNCRSHMQHVQSSRAKSWCLASRNQRGFVKHFGAEGLHVKERIGKIFSKRANGRLDLTARQFTAKLSLIDCILQLKLCHCCRQQGKSCGTDQRQGLRSIRVHDIYRKQKTGIGIRAQNLSLSRAISSAPVTFNFRFPYIFLSRPSKSGSLIRLSFLAGTKVAITRLRFVICISCPCRSKSSTS